MNTGGGRRATAWPLPPRHGRRRRGRRRQATAVAAAQQRPQRQRQRPHSPLPPPPRDAPRCASPLRPRLGCAPPCAAAPHPAASNPVAYRPRHPPQRRYRCHYRCRRMTATAGDKGGRTGASPAAVTSARLAGGWMWAGEVPRDNKREKTPASRGRQGRVPVRTVAGRVLCRWGGGEGQRERGAAAATRPLAWPPRRAHGAARRQAAITKIKRGGGGGGGQLHRRAQAQAGGGGPPRPSRPARRRRPSMRMRRRRVAATGRRVHLAAAGLTSGMAGLIRPQRVSC